MYGVMHAGLAFLSGPPGTGEILVLFVVVLLVFGPRRLPEVARTVGRTLDQLRRASQDFRDQIMQIDESAPVTPEFHDVADDAGDDAEDDVAVDAAPDEGESQHDRAG